MLDQLVSPADPDLASASANLSQALIQTAPSGCDVAGILPATRGVDEDIPTLATLADVWRAPVAQRELAHAWRWGMPLGAAGGMVHSPTLLAPLVRHDRVHDHDQTVVTLWSLEAWLEPTRLARGVAGWQKAMLARAVRFADAVVVPTHAMAGQLAEIAPLGARIRVVSGAPSADVVTPDPARGRIPGIAERYVVAVGSDAQDLADVFATAADLDLDVVVVADRGDAETEAFTAAAGPAGLSAARVQVRTDSTASERAALFAGALAVAAPSSAPVFPWRLLEALAAGAPIVAADTAQNREILVDAALYVEAGAAGELGEAVRRAVTDESLGRRLHVLSADRSRAFSWRDAAQRVWQLHAEL